MGRAPPFGADTLRSLRGFDVVAHAAPAKPPRRTVGDKRGDLGRLGARQQKERARLLRMGPVRRRAAVDRRQNFGAFGKMTGYRLEPPHAVRAETLAQRIDQSRATLGFVVICGGEGEFSGCKLSRRHRFGAGDGKTDGFEAEAGILHCRQRFELEIDETRHMGGAARRRREPDIERLDRAIDAVEAKPQTPRADIVAAEHVHQGLHEAAGAGDDRLPRDDRLEQIMQAVIDRRRHDRDERLVDAAERLVETAQELGGKTRGKRRARLVHERAHRFEAEPAERVAGFARQPQGCDGHRLERRGFLP